MFCKFCGVQIDASSVFCPSCGRKQNDTGSSSDYGSRASVSYAQPVIVQQPSSEMDRVNRMTDEAVRQWRVHIIAVFAILAVGLIAFFSKWFTVGMDLFYSIKLSLFELIEQLDMYADFASDFSDEDVFVIIMLIKWLIIGACGLFAVLLGITIKKFIDEYEETSNYAVALSISQIIFAVIVMLAVGSVEDIEVVSLTAAPYIFIACAVIAIIVAVYAKKRYEDEMTRAIGLKRQIEHSSSSGSAAGFRRAASHPLVSAPEIGPATITDEHGANLKIEMDTAGIKVSGLCNRGNVTKLVIPSSYRQISVVEIDSDAFKESTELQSVVLPRTVVRIGNAAFCDCRKLSEIALPEWLETIEDWAFCNCESLKKLVIPNSVVTIGETAFSGCDITICAPHEPSYYGYEPKSNVKWEIVE